MLNSKEIIINHNIQEITDIEKYKFNEFDLNQMGDHPSIVIFSRNDSSRNQIVRSILQHFSKKVPAGIIISPTDKTKSFYSDFIPDSYIYYEYKPDIIKRLLERQKYIIEKQKERKKEGKETNTRAFIVMDNCFGLEGKLQKDPVLDDLLFNGRQLHIMYILTMSFPRGIQPELRCNFDYIFLFADETISNQKRYFEHYASMFPNFEVFQKVFLELTADHGSMVIVNRGVHNKILFERIFRYKYHNIKDNK